MSALNLKSVKAKNNKINKIYSKK